MNSNYLRFIESAKRLKQPILAIAAVGAVLGGFAGYWNAYRAVRVTLPAEASASISSDVKPLSIVVLPFANHTGDPQKGYIADGLTNSITADLSRIRDAIIVPTSTAVTYRDKTVKAIGQELGVNFVLQGSVISDGKRIRIHAQLVETQTGAQKWTESFDGDMADLFALLDQVTARIGNSIGKEMVILAARASATRKSSNKVAELLLRAAALEMKPQSLQNLRAIESLQRQALAADRSSASATKDLATSLLLQAWNFPGLLNDDERAKLVAEGSALAEQARSMDPDSPEVSGLLAMRAWLQGDTASALRYAEKYAAGIPHSQGAQNGLAVFYTLLGQAAKSIETLKNALALYPKGNASLFGNLAVNYFMLGDSASTVSWALKAIDTGADDPDPYTLLAIAYSELGDSDKAHAASLEARRRFPDLRPPSLDARECVSDTWCEYLRAKYLPAWRRAGLP